MVLLLLIFKFVPNTQWAALRCGTGQRENLRNSFIRQDNLFSRHPESCGLEVCTTAFQKASDCTAYLLWWSFVIYQGADLLDYLNSHLKSCQFFLQKFVNTRSAHFPWKDVEEYWSCFNDLKSPCFSLAGTETVAGIQKSASLTSTPRNCNLPLKPARTKKPKSFPFCTFPGTPPPPKSRLLVTLHCNKRPV